tara:strand:+ start:1045 stop:2565 length:1521 start_codon:yes stop_codon:yes gene_type:complete
MKYNFFLPSADQSSVFGILIDEALKLKKEGSDVSLYYCDNVVNICKSNPLGQKSKCVRCRLKHKHLLKKHFKNENCFSLNEITSESQVLFQKKDYKYSSISEIKQIEFDNTNIGLGSYSTYVSLTRNCDPLINNEFKRYFDMLLNESSKMVLIFNQIIQKKTDSTVCLFNGRFIESRPIVEVCANNNIEFRCYEAGITMDGKTKKLFFKNSLPHDMLAFTAKANYYWERNEKIQKKIKISDEFFERKLNNLPVGDKVFTKNQDRNLLPSNWDKKHQNIVIFTSSEDEFVGIGGEWDEHSLFTSQVKGIIAIAEMLKEERNTHLYIRIHPNLKDIKYKYHTDILNLESQFKNITIIKGDSLISSYTLLENSNKVVVFNSTMGVEANKIGKPVILLTAAIYYYLDIAYKPQTVDDLFNMLINPLEPKPTLGASKYAYYNLFVEENYFNYINFSDIIQKNIFNKSLHFPHFANFFGSNILFSIYFTVVSRIKTLFSDTKIIEKLPVIEK